MALEIGIKVDSRQVADARREVEALNRSWTGMQGQDDIAIGVGSNDELANTASMLVKIREEVARMGELSRTGGGLIRKEQFAEAGDLAKRVRDDIRSWTTEIDNAKDALKKLAVEKASLEREATHNKRQQATEHPASASRLDAITAKEKEALARIKHLQDQKAKVFPLEDQALRPVTTVKGPQAEKWAEHPASASRLDAITAKEKEALARIKHHQEQRSKGMPLERYTRTTPTAPQMEWLPRERPQVLEAAKKEQLQGDRQPRATSPTPEIHGQGEPSPRGVTSTEELSIPALMAKTREDVRRMGELSRAATTRGGLLPKKQFEEAEGLGKRVQVSFSKWTDEINKARESLKKLAAEKENIGRDLMMGKVAPDQIAAVMIREESLEVEERAARERVKSMERQQEKLQPLQNRASQYSSVLGNTGLEQAQAASALGGTIKKTLGLALAAAGGFSLMSFLSQSRGKYQEYVGHEDTLYARGVRGKLGKDGKRGPISDGGGDAAALGIDPMEHYALQEQLTRSMGLGGRRLGRMSRNTELFAKAYGMNTSEVGGFGSSVYRSTGSRDLPASTLIAMQQQGIEKTRMPETMKLVEGHLRVMADARKGAGLGEGSVATALALATAAMREKNPEMSAYLKSGNLTNTLQNGLQGAGSPAGEIAIANAVGMFDGPMTYKKIHEMNMLRQGGFMERPDLMKKLLSDMPPGLDRAGKAGWLETKYPEWAKGKTSEQLLTLFDPESGALNGMHRDKLGGNENGAVAAMLKQIEANPAFSKTVRQAQKTHLKAQTGEGIDALIEPIETRVLQGADKILDSDLARTVKQILEVGGGDPNDYTDSYTGQRNRLRRSVEIQKTGKGQPYYREMLEASKKTRVPIELLQAIAENESGFKSDAVSPKGAMGVMQLMPDTAKRLGVKHPMDPGENIMGAAKHLAYLNRKYNGDMTAVLAAYNMGETKYDRQGVPGGGRETREYVAKVGGSLLARTGEQELPKAQSTGDRIANDIAGMFSTVTVGGFELALRPVKMVLDRIATALERPAQAQPLPINQ